MKKMVILLGLASLVTAFAEEATAPAKQSSAPVTPSSSSTLAITPKSDVLSKMQHLQLDPSKGQLNETFGGEGETSRVKLEDGREQIVISNATLKPTQEAVLKAMQTPGGKVVTGVAATALTTALIVGGGILLISVIKGGSKKGT
jgi:hypothetical protein